MPLPVDLSTAVVTMTAEKGDGSPETGTVTFTRSVVLQSPTDNLFITPFDAVATLDGTGHIQVTLPVTNDADYAPSFVYDVHIQLSKWEYRFSMTLTANVDLADVIGTVPADPPSAYVLLASVGAAGGVASLDGAGQVPLSQLGNAPSSGGGGTPSGTVVAGTSFGQGTAVGVLTTYSRGDHSHGTPSLATAGTTTSAVGDAAAVGSGSTAAKNDHTHGREAFGAVAAQTAYGASSANGTALTVAHSDHVHGTVALSAVAPTTSAVADAAAVGTGTVAARSDHVHGREAFGAVTAQTAFGAASANGTAVTEARSDHTHGTPAAQTAASLGLVIGTNVQAFNANLTTIAGLTPTTDNFMVANASAWASRTPAQAKASLAIGQADVSGLTAALALLAPLASPTFTGTVTAPRVIKAPQAISVAAAHLATNAANGDSFISTVNANFTLDNPTNPVNGQVIQWMLIQDATGSRVMTLDTKFALGTDITAAVLSTAANKRDVLLARYDSTADKWYVIAFVKGY